MRRADRLFDIIQVLRLARTPVTAVAITAEINRYQMAALHRL
jgi:predicted DNA-binding transcriptional regulator YafY